MQIKKALFLVDGRTEKTWNQNEWGAVFKIGPSRWCASPIKKITDSGRIWVLDFRSL